jgi:hypothetical protein
VKSQAGLSQRKESDNPLDPKTQQETHSININFKHVNTVSTHCITMTPKKQAQFSVADLADDPQ